MKFRFSNNSIVLVLMIFLVSIFSVNANSETVAVVDFTNNTGEHLPEIGKTAAEILSTQLTNITNFQVVEREKLSKVKKEQDFSVSGLVDQNETAIQLGKILGAEYIVTGSLLNLNLNETEFSGYGIDTTKVDVTLDTNIKLLDVTTSEIKTAGMYSASESYQDETKHSLDVKSVARNLMGETFDKFVSETEKEMDSEEDEEREEVKVKFESEPENASIEIDGIYIGSTPVELPVEEGTRKIKISKGGYENWEKKVRIYEGLEVSASLGEKENKEE